MDSRVQSRREAVMKIYPDIFRPTTGILIGLMSALICHQEYSIHGTVHIKLPIKNNRISILYP